MVRSKWNKTNVLLRHAQLRKWIPRTEKMSRQSLRKLLNRYGTVFIKPDTGSFGQGVMKIRQSEHRFQCHSGTVKRLFRQYDSLYKYVKAHAQERDFIVQQGVPLIHTNRKPVDFRVVVQKNANKCWVVTGIIARIAPSGKIVTNGSSGGTVAPARSLLAERFDSRAADSVIYRFRKISLMTASTLSAKWPQLHELGLDLAVTSLCSIRILEVNTRPDPVPFMKLKDKSMLQRIIRYGKRNGRTYRLKPKYWQKPV